MIKRLGAPGNPGSAHGFSRLAADLLAGALLPDSLPGLAGDLFPDDLLMDSPVTSESGREDGACSYVSL